jgi:hypothetical protein
MFIRVQLNNGNPELIAIDQIARISKKASNPDSDMGPEISYIFLKDGTELKVIDSINTLEARIKILIESR